MPQSQDEREKEHWEGYERIKQKPLPRPIRRPFTAYIPPTIERSKANILEIA